MGQGNKHNQGSMIEPLNEHQRELWQNLRNFRANFALGPAGTGKTLLAVDAAAEKLKGKDVSKILLVTPAVGADEENGFLPGTIESKVGMYMQPLLEYLDETGLGQIYREDLEKKYNSDGSPNQQHISRIEISPLQYMRGRTFKDAFVILDEAQNTTPRQMKMFTTRMGEGSHIAITGDHTQSDLDIEQNGLDYAAKSLEVMEGIAMVAFNNADSVRDPMVTEMLKHYDAYDAQKREAGNKAPEPKPQ